MFMRFIEHLLEGLAKPTYRDRRAEKAVAVFADMMIMELEIEKKRRGPHFIDEIIEGNSWNEELSYTWDNFTDKYVDDIIKRVKEHFGHV